jgi:hypothetical protein
MKQFHSIFQKVNILDLESYYQKIILLKKIEFSCFIFITQIFQKVLFFDSNFPNPKYYFLKNLSYKEATA